MLKKLKELLKNDYLLNRFLYVGRSETTKNIIICFNDKSVTITKDLLGWWCEGSIMSSEARHLNELLKELKK